MAKDTISLEKAAKYLCTVLDGRCPMVVERYPCPVVCTLDTVPWQCWVVYFQAQRTEGGDGGGRRKSGKGAAKADSRDRR